jgi:acyl-CoA thioester hydrolase
MFTPPSAEVEIEIPFHDVDSMLITWHGHYVKYLEIARCELLNKIGFGYVAMSESGYAWPVIDMHLRYPGATRFEQKIIVKATIVEWENRLKIDYIVRDKETGKRLTKASTSQVAVDIKNQEMLFRSPDVLFEKLGLSQ